MAHQKWIRNRLRLAIHIGERLGDNLKLIFIINLGGDCLLQMAEEAAATAKMFSNFRVKS